MLVKFLDNHPDLKEKALNFVYKYWEWMPVKVRIWSFLNDRDISGGK